MGTPDFAVPSLRALIAEGYPIAAVVTQPDRPKGRKRVLTAPPVKIEAQALGIPVLQPEKLRHASAIEELAGFAPDLIVTAAYGQILPKAVLALPKFGCINVHGSLLPKYRGAAPIQYAIMNGEQETGVTIMYMEEGLDTGDMISTVRIPITEADDAGTLFDKLSREGAELLRRTIPQIYAGTIKAVPQQDEEATYARMLTRAHEYIDWSKSAKDIFNQVRGLRPWPGAFTTMNDQVLKIWRCEYRLTGSEPQSTQEPGEVIRIGPDGIEIRCGQGTAILTEVQPAGKKAMSAAELLNSGRVKLGDRLGGGHHI